MANPAPSGGPVMPSTLPAGPALIGFSMTVTDMVGTTTCGLYSFDTGALIAAAAPVGGSTPLVVAMTQVVSLSSPTNLELACTNPFSDLEFYTNLSMYALSFATT